MGVRHPAAPLGLISVAAMLPGSWTAHLVDCNTASITDGDFGERNVSQQADTLRSTQRCKQRTTILPQTSPCAYKRPQGKLLPSTAMSRRPARLFVIRRRKV